MAADLRTPLLEGAEALGLELGDARIDALVAYVELLAKWNQAFNLTAVRDPREMVERHLLDSLAVVPHLLGDHVLDLGSGAGLPGVPLAVAFPERRFTLLDGNGKKTRFLTQVKAALGLDNVSVVHCRVEQYHPERPFDEVVTRAFATLADTVSWARHLLAPGATLSAMKGQVPEEEIAAVAADWAVDVIPLRVPGLEQAQRHLVRLTARPAG